MDKAPVDSQLANQIARDLGLEFDEDLILTPEELLDLVANRVAELLEKRPETLFSLLYRLDVDEKKVESVLSFETEQPKNVALAAVIIDRQEKRLMTKRKYKVKPIDNWGDY